MPQRIFSLLTALVVGAAAPVAAQQPILLRGDNGCAPTCQRSDGMSCSPCHATGIGPGDAQWSSTLKALKDANERFSNDVAARAKSDADYRGSKQFKADRDIARDMRSDVKKLQGLRAD